MVQAVIQFKEYHVLETIYRNHVFSSEGSDVEGVSPEFMFGFAVNQANPRLVKVELGISIGDENQKETSFFVKARIVGIFEIMTELDQEQLNSLIKVNAVAILYPYLRSLVTDLTSRGSAPPIILPTMNIAALLEEHEKSEKAIQDDRSCTE